MEEPQRIFLGNVQKLIITLLGTYGRLHTSRICRMLKKPYNVVLNALRGLKEKGLVEVEEEKEYYPGGIGYLVAKYYSLTGKGWEVFRWLVRSSRTSR